MDIKRKKKNLRASEGSILVLTLWILTMLVLLSVGLGYTTSIDQRLVSYQRDRLRALYLAKAGYFRALAEIQQDSTPEVDSYLETWAQNPEVFQDAALGEGIFTVSYSVPGEDGEKEVVHGVVDEDRKVNINTAPEAVLLRLPGMDEEIVESILEWREKHSAEGEGKEKGKEEEEAKPFGVLEELLRVEGMTEEVFEALQPVTTVYTDGKVNVNTSPKEVLGPLGMDDGLVDKILRFRKGLDGIRGTEDDQLFTDIGGAQQQLNAFEPLTPEETTQLIAVVSQNLLKVTSGFFRIYSRGTVRDGKIIRSVEGVIQRPIEPEGSIVVLSWHEY
ncbi:MAG: PilX N-terminal domain-containing pilus assembly protein [Candidatus Binatia bacterium]